MRSAAELRRLSELLDQVLDLPASLQADWVRSLDGPDQALAPALLEMLAERAAGAGGPSPVDRGPAFTAPAPDEGVGFKPGDAVGPFRLVRPLGRGGMGEVWLAERDDGQLRRPVALKLPMLAARRSVLVQRFGRERDILAALAHPHIARLYDAGVADDGQPYLALEYVEGLPITEHCQVHRLAIPERVKLLLQVLQAVQHAHTNLVIHRDLKPSNVLVTSQGQAMLLDFGIAKLLAEAGTHAEETELTQVGGRAMTLDFAAPEQITGAPVSTATDVWALGVLLHELVSGERPFRSERRNLVEGRILSGERTRLTLPAAGTSALRPARLAELDTIVGKALKKEPQHRYTTAAALADDLLRWLRDEPVLAQPDSRWYRASKFVTRHRGAVAGTAAVLLAILGAAAVAVWQAQVAREQARIASSQARTSQAVQDFLEGILKVNRSEQADPIAAREKTARQVLEDAADRVGQSLLDAPEAKARVLVTLAEMLENVERRDLALRMLEERVELIGQTEGHGSDAHIRALLDVGRRLLIQRRSADSRRLVDQALALAAARPAVPASLTVSLRLMQAMLSAGPEPQVAVAVLRQAVQAVPQGPINQEWLAASVMLAAGLRKIGDSTGAERTVKETLAALPRLASDDLTEVQRLRIELAQRAAGQGRTDEAMEQLARMGLYFEGVQIGRLGGIAGQAMWNHRDVPRQQLASLEMIRSRYLRLGGDDGDLDFVIRSVQNGILSARIQAGQIDSAAKGLQQWQRSARAMEQMALPHSAALAIETGRFEDAAGAIGQWRAQLEAPAEPGDAGSQATARERNLQRRRLARVEWLDLELSVARGDAVAARAKLARLADLGETPGESVDAQRAPLEAELQMLEGRPQSAASTAQAALDALRIRRAGAPHLRLNQVLGQALLALGRPAEAVAALEQALQMAPAVVDPQQSPRVAACLGLLAQARLALGERAKAQESLMQAEQILARHRQVGPQYTAPVAQARQQLAPG